MSEVSIPDQLQGALTNPAYASMAANDIDSLLDHLLRALTLPGQCEHEQASDPA